MDLDEIKTHWENLAELKGDGLEATTRTETIKRLEIDAFRRWIEKKKDKEWSKILEIGCGNGTNCIELSKLFPEIRFFGVDYIEGMILKAKKRAGMTSNIVFDVDDVTVLKSKTVEDKMFDAIITDRCLINLNTVELQKRALYNIFSHIKVGGFYFMIENSKDTYGKQNDLRSVVGLEKRCPAEFNLFLDDQHILNYLTENLHVSLEAVDNFASLHDLILYVIEPLANGGIISYGSEAVNMVTDFLLQCGNNGINKFGEFGQNRMYVFRRNLDE